MKSKLHPFLLRNENMACTSYGLNTYIYIVLNLNNYNLINSLPHDFLKSLFKIVLQPLKFRIQQSSFNSFIKLNIQLRITTSECSLFLLLHGILDFRTLILLSYRDRIIYNALFYLSNLDTNLGDKNQNFQHFHALCEV